MPPLPASLHLKIERRQAAYKPVALTLRHVQWATSIVIVSQILPTSSLHLWEYFKVHRLRPDKGERLSFSGKAILIPYK